jgi:hypothetical protein
LNDFGGCLARTVQGLAYTWQVSDKPIGSGDAGEVYAVTCLNQPALSGMMKKPARIATAGTLQRQAGQIAQEARALALLEGLPGSKAHPPRLLDQAPDFTQGTSNYFIISETAPGEDLLSMLAQSRQTGKPFPRRVIMTVLDALFDMFSRAHKAGVLWNDVKLEHIYWHNLSGQVGVIDWGNALFLDRQPHLNHPRWEDYQQLVDTLGSFLQSSAPDLFVELGWDEFQGQNLDSPRVSVLARRITYQQQVIAHRVMEYQSLIRVVLSSEPTLEGLHKINDYNQALDKIGAPCEQEEVLQYGQHLLETALTEGDRQTSVSTTALIWELFDESLDLSWHLMREYCRHADILTHPAFPDLVKNTLNEQWTGALWVISMIASQASQPAWWQALMPAMRQKALDTTTPSPFQACQSLYKWAAEQHNNDLHQKLLPILQAWRIKGTDDQDNPLDYDVLDILKQEKDLPSRLLADIKRSFAPGEEAIRELISGWKHNNLESIPEALRHVIRWDPDRWGIHRLAGQVATFCEWQKILYDGPGYGVHPRQFFEDLLESRPRIEHMLGTPNWLRDFLLMLQHIQQGSPISGIQANVAVYAPWLLMYPDLPSTEISSQPLNDEALHTQLLHFMRHLKNWSDIDAGLVELREKAQAIYPFCEALVSGFKNVLALNLNQEHIQAVIEEEGPSELNEARQVLNTLLAWRKCLSAQNLPGAVDCFEEKVITEWVVAAHAHQITAEWYHHIHPYLEAIHTCTPLSVDPPSASKPQLLHETSASCANLLTLWAQIDKIGLEDQLLETLAQEIEAIRMQFHEWRSTMENAPDPMVRLVYLSLQGKVRLVTTRMLRMVQHIRQAKSSYAMLDQANQTSFALQASAIENILDHLAGMEAELIHDPEQHRYPSYLASFRQYIHAIKVGRRRDTLTALAEDHPFYTWLVKSTLGSNTFYT